MINSQFVLHFSLNIISYMHSPILLQYTFLVKSLSRVQLSMTPWTIYIAHQAPLSMGFSRQEHWNGLSFPSPRDPPDPGIEPGSPELQADSLPSEPPGEP